MKILINAPALHEKGGVANHFLGLKGKFKKEVVFNKIGGHLNRNGQKTGNKLRIFTSTIIDFFRYIKKIIKYRPELVHINPSLYTEVLFRDGIYLLLAKILFRKVLVFWHGWDERLENRLNKGVCRFLFKSVFNRADGFCVLSSHFKMKLSDWGISKMIYLETTKVDDELLKNFVFNYRKKNISKLLFLSRIEKDKGIYETVDAFAVLHRKYKDIKLIIAGSGSEMPSVKKYIREKSFTNIHFCGYVSDEKKISVLGDSNIYILPTSHGEGMPTSVLEAMAFGLPVITRPVGGIRDFFEDGKMGYLTESLDPQVYADLIEKLIQNPEKVQQIGKFNHEYAKTHFLASQVARRLECIYESVLNNTISTK